jgi:hypothetical protein
VKVKLHILGPIKKTIQENPVILELPDGSIILDMMKKIGYSETEAKFLVYVKGEDRIKPYSKLQDGDEIKAVLQVGGG